MLLFIIGYMSTFQLFRDVGESPPDQISVDVDVELYPSEDGKFVSPKFHSNLHVCVTNRIHDILSSFVSYSFIIYLLSFWLALSCLSVPCFVPLHFQTSFNERGKSE